LIAAGARSWLVTARSIVDVRGAARGRVGPLAQFGGTYLGLSVTHQAGQPAVGMQASSLEQARRTLGDLSNRARLAGEPTMITRYGEPGAVVVSAGWYQDADCREQPADGPGRDRKACNRC
jgi:hypothetical protein